MFTSLLTHTITIKRPTATTGIKKTYQGSTAYSCLIQPLDDVATQAAGMAYGTGFRCYADLTADIREGDQAVDESGRKFFVKGIRRRNYGNFPHLDMLFGEDKRP